MSRITDFHKSIGGELVVISNRVRSLINHWGEDGRYKEAILMNILRKFVPKNYSIGTGFIVTRGHDRAMEHISSTQIDIIIYDNTFPTVFSEGDFVIVIPDSVIGIIEVKSNLKNAGIESTIDKSNSNGLFIKDNSNTYGGIFNGVFSYDGDYDNFHNLQKNIRASIEAKYNSENANYLVNHISFNNNLFLKYWNKEGRSNKLALYNTSELSFSFFISNLLNKTNELVGFLENALFFPEDKEICQIGNDF